MFKDHFSKQAQGYTQFRPQYPRELFQYLASLVSRRERAWDCGTGNGQAAIALAEYFDEVIATDPSASQIAQAERHPNVSYLVSTAEESPLNSNSVDLITVAQALHWFDLARFCNVARRVARPRGVLAAWSYGLATISPDVDRIIWRLYEDILGAYWPTERRLIEQGYKTIALPFDEFMAPAFAMTAEWNLADLIGYLGTWSSVQKYIEQHRRDPLELVQADLTAAWGPEQSRRIHWPLFTRIFCIG